MKRFFLFLLLIFTVISCLKELTISVAGVSLNTKPVSLIVGDSKMMECTVFPKDATHKNVYWSCSDASVAIIDGSGHIEAKGAGYATLYVRTEEGGFTDSCSVIVTQGFIPVESISLDHDALDLKESDAPAYLTVDFKPEEATNRNVTWSTSDSTVVTVADGMVTPRKAGVATITAISEDGQHKVTCEVKVTSPVTGVVISPSGDHSLFVNESLQLKSVVIPKNADNRKVVWTSSDPDIASVDNEGKVLAKAPGLAQIKVATEDGGFVDSSKITVLLCVDGITLSSKNLSIYEGEDTVLVATIMPETATEKRVMWSVIPNDIAKVEGDGLSVKINGVKAGKALVCVATVDGGKHASCEIMVNKHASSVKFEKNAIDLFVGQSYSLNAAVLPEDAFDKSLIWASDNASVVEVDKNGTVRAKQSGQAEITVKTTDGGHTDVCRVTVYKEADKFLFSPSSVQPIYEGDECNVSLVINPADAYHGEISVTSDNPDVATVSNDGQSVIIAAHMSGSAVIKATVDIGQSNTMTCTLPVEVRCHVESVSIRNAQPIVLYVEGESVKLHCDVLPERAFNKKLIFKTLSTRLVSVDENTGEIWASGRFTGETEVVAAAEDGPWADTCKVVVLEHTKVSNVEVAPKELELGIDSVATLVAKVTPEDAYDKSLIWKTDSPEIATVDSLGNVKAVSAGQTYINVYARVAASGEIVMDRCLITVVRLVESVGFETSELNIEEGSSQTLTATVLPENADNRTLTWTSSKPEVATVDSDGKVEAVSVGSAVITAKATDGSGKSASCTITVIPKKVKSVTLDKTALNLKEGESQALTATVLPVDADNRTLIWTSSEPAVATVDAEGTVKATGAGTAKITAKATDGSEKEATCVVTVSAKVKVAQVSFNVGNLTLKEDESQTLTATVLPEDADNRALIWTSSKPEVATVDSNGKVEAVSVGSAVITAMATDGSGKFASCIVAIVSKVILVTSVTLDEAALNLEEGSSQTLTATVLPENADNRNLNWTSSKSEVATVDSDGKVEAVSVGSAVITAMATDGSGKSASCTITVIPKKVKSVTLDKTALNLKEGESQALTATVLPEDAGNRTLIWTSSKPAVATVDAEGTVKATGAGTAKITARATDGSGKEATCVVTVSAKVKVAQVSFNVGNLTLTEGDSQTLTATVLPENADNRTLIWTSSKPEVATVDSNGKVESVSVGNAVITAMATDGSGKFANCIVTVVPKAILVTSVTLDETALNLEEGSNYTLTAMVLPENADNRTLNWTSSKPAVATVDSNGKVEAVSVGSAVITAMATDDSGKKATCVVTVSETTKKVTRVTLDVTELNLEVGKLRYLTPDITAPAGADRTLEWVSSDTSVATVDSDGKVVAVGKGTAVITATANNGSGPSATCTVVVTEKVNMVTSLTLSETSRTLSFGSSFTLTPTILPADATNPELKWTSSNESVASVSDGVVTAKSMEGTAVITASTTDGSGISKTCTVEVIPEIVSVTGIDIIPSSLEMYVNETKTLSFVITPSNASNQKVIWSTRAISNVIVDQTGKVTAKSVGTEYVTVETVDGGHTSTCTLTITNLPVQSISLDVTEVLLKMGEKVKLVYTIEPEKASNKNVSWTSSDTGVVTVDNSGIVTPKAPGKTTVTVTTKDGAKTATCEVKVVDPNVQGGGIQGITYDVWN